MGLHEGKRPELTFSLPRCEDTARRSASQGESSRNPATLAPRSRTSASRTVRNQFLWSQYPTHGILLWQPKLMHSLSCIPKICIFCCNVKFILISTSKNAFMKAFTVMAITKKELKIFGAQHEITFESFFSCFQSLHIVEFSF